MPTMGSSMEVYPASDRPSNALIDQTMGYTYRYMCYAERGFI
jgi:hypothetical protein